MTFQNWSSLHKANKSKKLTKKGRICSFSASLCCNTTKQRLSFRNAPGCCPTAQEGKSKRSWVPKTTTDMRETEQLPGKGKFSSSAPFLSYLPEEKKNQKKKRKWYKLKALFTLSLAPSLSFHSHTVYHQVVTSCFSLCCTYPNHLDHLFCYTHNKNTMC